MGLGNVLGGFAASRDARLARKAQDAQAETMKTMAQAKLNPAQGTGGTAVDGAGKDINYTPVPGTATPATSAATPNKTLGQKIVSGLKTAGKNLLGFKKGGRITKSGVAYVHKGESIIPATQERKPMRMSTRRSGRR